MKYLILLCFVLGFKLSFAETTDDKRYLAIRVKPSPKPSDAKFFLPYSDKLIIIPNVPESLLEKGSIKEIKLLKLPTSILKNYNLKAGIKIQSVDLINGSKHDYNLKDTINAFYKPNEFEGIGKGKLHIFVTDDIPTGQKLSSLFFNDLLIVGFSYFGKERKIHSAKERLIPTKEVNEKFVFENKIWNPKDKKVEIRSVNLFGNTLIVKTDTGSGRYEPLYKSKDGFFQFAVNYSILTRDLKFLRLAKWGENTELLFLQEANDVDVCFDLYFINKDGPSLIPLPCSLKDR